MDSRARIEILPMACQRIKLLGLPEKMVSGNSPYPEN
jgi:hypothetical protein